MSKHKGRKKLSEITNALNPKTLTKFGEPEQCVVYNDETAHDLDVVDLTSLEEGIFEDYQIGYFHCEP